MSNELQRYVSEEFSVMSAQSENSATFTAATSDIITSAAHGLSDGDCVTVASGTTLPAGLSASTYYYVINSATNTFKLSTSPGGTAVDITDAGTGTHTWYQEVAGVIFDVSDYRHVEVSIDAESSPNVTLKCVGSITDAQPTFLNPQTAANRYDFIHMIDKEDNTGKAGDEGIAIAAEDHRQFAINTNGLSFITFKTLKFVGGDITIKLKAFQD